jgi:hypothetical protein
VVAAAASAANGSTVCVTAGSYGAVTFTGARTGYVAVQPVDGATVTFADMNTSGAASWIKLRGFHVSAMIDVGNRSSSTSNHIIVEQGYSPGASWWTGTSDLTFSHNRFQDGGNQLEALGGNRVLVDGNQFLNPGCDAMFVTTGYQNVTITNNEITGVVENGCHADAFQSCGCSGVAGSNLNWSGNWEHDNFGQGFFIKDGSVTGVTFSDNLFERQTGSGANSNVWDVHGMTMQHNTIWDGKGFLFRGGNVTGAVADHNVIDDLEQTDGTTFSESDNLFGTAPWTFTRAASDEVDSTPPFTDVAAHDYRLTDGSGRGVTWRPSDKVFGPA